MNISPELIKKFLLNECTPAEADQIVAHFAAHPEEVEVYFGEQEWNDMKAFGKLPAANDKLIWNEIQQQALQQRVVKMKWVKRIAIAAAMMGAIAGGAWFLGQRPVTKTVAALTTNDSSNLAEIDNYTEHAQCVPLADGSEITLQPHSIVRYRQPFGKTDRALSLAGKAFFSVAHGSSKPFSVTAGGITTTALGTSFWVETMAKKVNVKLVTGRVVIQHASNKDFYLHPGQEITYDPLQPQATAITNTSSIDHKTNGTPLPNAKQTDIVVLSFNQTPLADVLRQLQQHYKVHIRFDESQLSHLRFSGAYGPADNVEGILKTVALANDLQWRKTAAGYEVMP